MVEAVGADFLEVRLCDPRCPMLRESVRSFVLAQCCRVGIFVNNSTAVCPFLEDRWGNPWLENEPLED